MKDELAQALLGSVMGWRGPEAAEVLAACVGEAGKAGFGDAL